MEVDTQSTGARVREGGGGYIWSEGKKAEGITHDPRGREQFTTMSIYDSCT